MAQSCLLLVLEAARELFELDAQAQAAHLDVAQGAAKRVEIRVIPAAHIVQPKVPKPPCRFDWTANRFS